MNTKPSKKTNQPNASKATPRRTNKPTTKKPPLSEKDLDEILLGAEEAQKIIHEEIPELGRILCHAWKKISKQKGQRKNPEADDYISLTWSGYCRDIGFSQSVANKIVDRFISIGMDRPLAPKEPKARRSGKRGAK
jgi:hypothetical protein